MKEDSLNNIYKKKPKLFWENQNTHLILGDSFEILKNIKSKSVDMIFADPPYFLSGDGITLKSGRMASVRKANWDEKRDIHEIHLFNKKWLRLCRRILKDNGTIWISGSMHNIYSVGMALQELKYKLINNITWQKRNPPPNISRRAFTHSTETVIWAKKDEKKSKHFFNYELMKEINLNKQMKDVWTTNIVSPSQKRHGKHPTQKPLELLERIVLSSTKEGSIIIDPFNGSGTTGVASIRNNRYYIGIDTNKDYLKISEKRIHEEHQFIKLL